MKAKLTKRIEELQNQNRFSGTVLVKAKQHVLAEISFGYANRSDSLGNNSNTRYGIASGCKLFTAIAVCQMVEKGMLSFDSKVKDCLNVDFPRFDEKITIHHLLAHISGISDYFDEEEMEGYERLWFERPMYRMRNPLDFLPLFQDKPMKLHVGERFHYNNAGYILLGCIVQQISGQDFAAYVQENIFQKAGMESSGYFEMDALPANTAIGYIDLGDGAWKTNIYSLPAKGGPDGGAFATVHDMDRLWNALMDHALLSETYTKLLLETHAHAGGDDHYGYGVWIKKGTNGKAQKYHVMGYDPGVCFHSAYYPEQSVTLVVCSNQSGGAFEMMAAIEDEIIGKR
ncbi:MULTISPECIES: serine hydrolase domain-containing protein [Paenibacillus]|uniref:Penicillin-binding protein n=1 Tax=Paenibacillus albilobatus TaxID=2716884 RepID=A0A919XF09_9BACL|nr:MULTISPECIES: serine hydrolase [Paenibacillus]GIO30976.1 penicillin-binding protein [Paenibacillus albilobatus]